MRTEKGKRGGRAAGEGGRNYASKLELGEQRVHSLAMYARFETVGMSLKYCTPNKGPGLESIQDSTAHDLLSRNLVEELHVHMEFAAESPRPLPRFDRFG